MTIKNIFSVASKAVVTNKVRSLLTMLGVIIGVFAVTILTAIGNGLQAYVTEQFESLGSNNILVFPGDIFNDNGGFNREKQLNAFSNSKLKLRDVRELDKLRQYIEYAVPFISNNDEASYRIEKKSVTVVGTEYHYQDIMKVVSNQGRFFDKTEDQSAKKVVVLGSEVKAKLFGNTNALGKRIKLGNQTFTVIGVADKKGGGFGGPSFDEYVYIPFKTYQKVYDNDSIRQIMAKAISKDIMPEAIKAVEQVMSKRLNKDEFSIIDQTEILKTINEILSVFTVGLGGIAAISLLVGGIGIMNIMLVSVTERTREIGLRKALGATPTVILLQFLVEASIISVLGGVIGLILAYLVTIVIQPYFPAKITTNAVMLAFSVSTLVGLVFGSAPAKRASELSPIEALRYE